MRLFEQRQDTLHSLKRTRSRAILQDDQRRRVSSQPMSASMRDSMDSVDPIDHIGRRERPILSRVR